MPTRVRNHKLSFIRSDRVGDGDDILRPERRRAAQKRLKRLPWISRRLEERALIDLYEALSRKTKGSASETETWA